MPTNCTALYGIKDNGSYGSNNSQSFALVAVRQHFCGGKIIIPLARQPKARPKKGHQHQAGEVDQLKTKGADPAGIGKAGQTNQHKGTVGCRTVGQSRHHTANSTVGQEKIGCTLPHAFTGQSGHNSSQDEI